MKTKLKDMTIFWNEQHKDNQYFDCKNDYRSDLIKRYNMVFSLKMIAL